MMYSESIYHDLADRIVKRMARNGLEVEVYYNQHSKLQISIEQSAIKSEREETTQGFSFRVAKDNRIGRTYANTAEFSKLLNVFGVPEEDLNKLAIMNGMQLNDMVRAGTRIKIIA